MGCYTSLTGTSALGGEEGVVTFPVISVHWVGGVIPALPRVGPTAMVQVEFSSTDVGFEAEGVGGGIAGEVFFRVAHTFCFREGPFFILQRTKLSKSGNTAEQGGNVLADLLLARDVDPARVSSSSDDLAPIVTDWLFLFRLSTEAEEKVTGRLVTLLDDDVPADPVAETPGI